jgi:uncharacterized membrane protein YbhN (UPF0104 family)
MSEATETERRRTRPWARAAQVAISLVLVAGIFIYAIPRIADYSTVWATIRHLTGIEMSTLFGAMLLNLVTYWPVMMASMPGLTFAQAAVNNQTTTSIANTLPGGGAIAVGLSYAMYRSWGFTNAAIALTTLVTGIWNTFIKLALPVVALAVLAIQGQATGALVLASAIGVVVLLVALTLLVLTLWKREFARAIGSGLGRAVSVVRRWLRKPPVSWGEAAVRFRKQTIALLRSRWLPLTVSTVASHLALYLVLLLALRHVGVSGAEIGWAQVLGVFAFGRLVTALPITPGGLGIVELSYIGGLVLAGESRADVPAELFRAQVAAAVLVFRTLTYALQIPLGGFTYLVWQRMRRWRKPPPREPGEPAPAVA